MRQRLADYKLFWREFRHTFHTTGSILPSGPSLARALASQIEPGDAPQHILEAGPGTGAVTGQIIDRLGPEDRLDLVELNQRFADVLRERLECDAKWHEAAHRVRVLKMPLQKLEGIAKYSRIVSGLPLSNFSRELVQDLFAHFHRLAAPQAMLSFFEYVALRKAKAICCQRRERLRLSSIDRILHREFSRWETQRQCISANVPPAWVHHLRMPGGFTSRSKELAAATT